MNDFKVLTWMYLRFQIELIKRYRIKKYKVSERMNIRYRMNKYKILEWMNKSYRMNKYKVSEWMDKNESLRCREQFW